MRSVIALSLLLLVLLAPLAGAEEWSPIDVIKFQGVQNPELVLRRIAKGEYDIGLFSLPADEYRRLDKDLLKNLELYKTVVSYNELTFNTYHDPDKDAPIVTLGNETYFNPFAIMEVRFAMNYLISRDYVVQNVYQNGGAPMFGCIRPSHPASKYFEAVYTALNLTGGGNEGLALKMIDEAMGEAAEQVAKYGHVLERRADGFWYFDGRPVTIKFVIRIEDERKEIGMYVSKQLQKAGFAVEELFWDRQKAGQVVFAKPPSNYEWNIYTGGWLIRGSPSLWIDDYAAWFYSAWYGYLPGAIEPKHRNTVTVLEFLNEVGNGNANAGLRAIGAAYYQNTSELGEMLNWTEEELTKLLTNLSLEVNGRSYTINNADQYWDLQKIAMGIGIMESARVFLVEEWELSPVNRERVTDIVSDPATGILNRWSVLNAKTPDGVLKVAYFIPTCGGFCLPFNPVSGFDTHVFPANLWGLVHDPGGFVGPDGLYTPYRCRWEIERGEFTVPGDAVIYNQTQGWIAAHAGESAKVKVRVTCDFGRWHDGVKMRTADLKYYIAFLYTWAYKDGADDPYYDGALSDTAASLRNILGFQFTNDSYIVYGSYAHPFADDVTAKAYVFYPDLPWELYYAMGELVTNSSAYDTKTKYSFSESGRGVECLNLLSKEYVADLRKVLMVLRDKNAVPAAITEDVGDPREGYTRAIEWIDAKGHAVISNGPFYIEKYEPENLFLELRAFQGASPVTPSDSTPTTSQVSTSSSQSESPPPTNGSDDHQTATNTSLIYAIGLAGLLILVLVLLMGWKR
ncbi:peptide ABC transporter substrate-binding protein [Thermococcus sp. M36]|uniref:ABC transporter substrate-binding protein n=1 Tax=Thermococcus sp. M36 TaxID=1638261 RepID=UPI00143A017E|nr:ABC transporter substrate-binding protein [Thermococcus sp. M36]NJE06088.1 peptide ABC transporter substrate-binding protein [Thermococcus sp. M36]